MQKLRFDNSLKNIAIPSRDAYMKGLIDKTENIIRRVRWKSHFLLDGDKDTSENNAFGSKSGKTRP